MLVLELPGIGYSTDPIYPKNESTDFTVHFLFVGGEMICSESTNRATKLISAPDPLINFDMLPNISIALTPFYMQTYRAQCPIGKLGESLAT